MRDFQREGCWPAPSQELLLKAALFQGDAALSAWRSWQQITDFEALDGASQRLVPLLYRNLLDQGVPASLLHRYKGFYRWAWYRNQALFHGAASVLKSLTAAGIKTMVLKGVALALLHYRDAGARPMVDFDIMAPAPDAGRAIEVLIAQGWEPWSQPYRPLTPSHLATVNGHTFKNPQNQEMDLHWHLLSECCYEEADRTYWDGAVPLRVAGVPTLALNPTDLLFHTCVHGYKWNRVPPFRWVADAIILLRSAGPEIDWRRLVDLAIERQLTLATGNTLAYLQATFAVSVPSDTLQTLAQYPVSYVERHEYRVATRPTSGRAWVWAWWGQHRRVQRNRSLAARLASFPTYVQHILALDHVWDLPLFALGRIGRRSEAQD